MSSSVRVKQLFIHPVKGLTPQAQQQVHLQAGHGIPGDRAFALLYTPLGSNDTSSIVPWMKKRNFAMQCDLPALAALTCLYNPMTQVLTVKRQGVELLIAETQTAAGRDTISSFFTGYLAAIAPHQAPKNDPARACLRFVGDSSGTTRYPDREVVHLSLVSAATIEHLSEVAGQSVDVRRFRPNIVLEGVAAWEEFSWVGQHLQLGQAQLEVTAPINRCLNIDVNPDTGERDIPLFTLLQKHFGHKQTGILAKVVTDGDVAVGDSLTFPTPNS